MKLKVFGFDVSESIKKGIPKLMGEKLSERDVHTCQVCFTPQHKLKSPKRRSIFPALSDDDDNDTLHGHHIVKLPIGLTVLGNLILVCRHCHRDIHQIIDHPYYDIEYLREHLDEIGMKAIEECRRRKKILRDQGLLSADSD
ncbi:MAG: HNH endonuclease signature motif containing protein [Nitrososphaeraceae archaeon]